jgi:hypothetical protein
MSSFLLVCAVVASLAVGVFVAQAICIAMFEAFRIHARQVAATQVAKTQTAALKTVQG